MACLALRPRQLNDPDPSLWIGLYMFGGAGLNGLFSWGNASVAKGVAKGFVGFCCSYAGLLAYRVTLNLQHSDRAPISLDSAGLRRRGWELLEFEEAREFVGLIMLILHTFQLLVAFGQQEVGTQKSAGYNHTGIANIMMAVVTIVLLGACYMWYFYQPELNMRMKEPHCDGQLQPSRME